MATESTITTSRVSAMNDFRALSAKKPPVSESRKDNDNNRAKPNAPSLFESDSESGNSEAERKPVTRTITSASEVHLQSTSTTTPNRVTTIKQEKFEGTVLKEDVKSVEKGSQIARLVERRRTAERELELGLNGEATDETLFRYDVDKCPEHAGVVQYEQTPVDGFGEAMLRAMGWRGKLADGRGDGLKLRPARLGLGAKLGGSPPPLRKDTRKRERSSEKWPDGEKTKETLKGLGSEDESSELQKNSRQKVPGEVRKRPPTEDRDFDKAQEKKSADLKFEQWDGSNEKRKENGVYVRDKRPHTANGQRRQNWIRSKTADQHTSHSRTREGLADTGRHRFQDLDGQEERLCDRTAGRRDKHPPYAHRSEDRRWSHDNRRREESQSGTEERRWSRTGHKTEGSRDYGDRGRQRRSRFSNARM